MRQIVERVVAAWGSGNWHSPEQTAGHTAHHEATFLKLDITKATHLLHWKPAFSVDQAVDQTVSWYRQRATAGSGIATRALCLQQIADYKRASPLQLGTAG